MNSERLRALLLEPHQSYLRNPLIAKVFYLAGYIEQYGSGTVRMVEWMKEADLPEPEYKEELGGLSVYFYKDIYPEENLRKMGLMDAILQDKQKSKISSSDKTKAFIEKARRCKEKKYKSVGQGTDHRFEGRAILGSALLYRKKVIHMAFFKGAESSKTGRMSSYSQRRELEDMRC